MRCVQIVCITLLIVFNIASASWFSDLLGSSKSTPKEDKTKVPSKKIIAIPKSLPPMKKRDLNATIIPLKHSFDDYLLKKVEENVQRLGKMTKVIFIGDSFFYKVSKSKTRWASFEEKHAALNLGSPGDRSEHVLYRFRDGNVLSNITSESPLVITMVGTSNVNVGDSPLAVVAGVQAVISLLKTYLKNPKILILSLIPRDSGKPIDSVITDVNKHLQKIVDIKKEKNVEYVDIAKQFLTPNGTVNFSLYTTDQINPNAAGQDAVFAALEPYTSKLEVLKNVPPPAARQVITDSSKLASQITKKPVLTKDFKEPTTTPATSKPLAKSANSSAVAKVVNLSAVAKGVNLSVVEGKKDGKVLEVKKSEEKVSEVKVSDGKKATEVKVTEGKVSEGKKATEVKVTEVKKTSEGKLPEGQKVVEGKLPDGKKAPEGKVSEVKKTPAEMINSKAVLPNAAVDSTQKSLKTQTTTAGVTDKTASTKDPKAVLANKSA